MSNTVLMHLKLNLYLHVQDLHYNAVKLSVKLVLKLYMHVRYIAYTTYSSARNALPLFIVCRSLEATRISADNMTFI